MKTNKKNLFFNYFWQRLVKWICKESSKRVFTEDYIFLHKTTFRSLLGPTQRSSDTPWLPADLSRLQIQISYHWLKVKPLIYIFICFISYSLLLCTDKTDLSGYSCLLAEKLSCPFWLKVRTHRKAYVGRDIWRSLVPLPARRTANLIDKLAQGLAQSSFENFLPQICKLMSFSPTASIKIPTSAM